jgi:hypothetical protein
MSGRVWTYSLPFLLPEIHDKVIPSQVFPFSIDLFFSADDLAYRPRTSPVQDESAMLHDRVEKWRVLRIGPGGRTYTSLSMRQERIPK